MSIRFDIQETSIQWKDYNFNFNSVMMSGVKGPAPLATDWRTRNREGGLRSTDQPMGCRR